MEVTARRIEGDGNCRVEVTASRTGGDGNCRVEVTASRTGGDGNCRVEVTASRTGGDGNCRVEVTASRTGGDGKQMATTNFATLSPSRMTRNKKNTLYFSIHGYMNVLDISQNCMIYNYSNTVILVYYAKQKYAILTTTGTRGFDHHQGYS